MAGFADTLKEAAAKIKGRLAPNSLTAGGLTAAQLAAQMPKSDYGLGNVENYTVATDAEMRAGTATNKYVECTRAKERIDLAMEPLENYITDGAILYGDDTAEGVGWDTYCKTMFIAESDSEVEHAKTMEQSFSDVFNGWYRFSHKGSNLPQPNLPDEMTKWSYTEATDTIVCTVNSASHIGFISQEPYENYEFEVELSSTNADDDSIGVIVGFAKVDGIEYTLTVQRAMGGFKALFYICYQLGGTGEVLHHSYNGFENYKNGSPGGANGNNGWSGGKTCRIKVIRKGDILTINATDVNQTTYSAATEVTLDLAAHDHLHKFRGGSAYGYSCFSQHASSFRVITRPGAFQDFIDSRTMELWRHDGNDWYVASASEMDGSVFRNRMYLNTDSKKLFYYPLTGDILKISEYGSMSIEGSFKDYV